MSNQYYIYILTNKNDRVLYTGVTNNLKKRIYEHKNHLDSKSFTSKYNVGKLVYYEIAESPEVAIKREKQIKNLVRRKKVKLIEDFNPKWKDLYDEL